ncbi:hypothetical protein [Kibdelosporangium aridum]|uniref:hypothetical protein n=1 Tax=Kibdelosporangium aridum TaxID=2030 RepID=UPI0035EACB7A
MADPGYRHLIAGIDRPLGYGGPGPFGEQPHRVITSRPVRLWPAIEVGRRQRKHRKDVLALDAQRVAAGSQDPQPRSRSQQHGHQFSARVHDVFTVVENQQQPLVLQAFRQGDQ